MSIKEIPQKTGDNHKDIMHIANMLEETAKRIRAGERVSLYFTVFSRNEEEEQTECVSTLAVTPQMTHHAARIMSRQLMELVDDVSEKYEEALGHLKSISTLLPEPSAVFNQNDQVQ